MQASDAGAPVSVGAMGKDEQLKLKKEIATMEEEAKALVGKLLSAAAALENLRKLEDQMLEELEKTLSKDRWTKRATAFVLGDGDAPEQLSPTQIASINAVADLIQRYPAMCKEHCEKMDELAADVRLAQGNSANALKALMRGGVVTTFKAGCVWVVGN